MRKGFLTYKEMRKYLPIYEEGVSHILLCNCSILNFFFISVLYSRRVNFRAFRRKVVFGKFHIAHDTDDIRSNRCFHMHLRGGGLADIVRNTDMVCTYVPYCRGSRLPTVHKCETTFERLPLRGIPMYTLRIHVILTHVL